MSARITPMSILESGTAVEDGCPIAARYSPQNWHPCWPFSFIVSQRTHFQSPWSSAPPLSPLSPTPLPPTATAAAALLRLLPHMLHVMREGALINVHAEQDHSAALSAPAVPPTASPPNRCRSTITSRYPRTMATLSSPSSHANVSIWSFSLNLVFIFPSSATACAVRSSDPLHLARI